MAMTVNEKADLIIKEIRSETSTSPVQIFRNMARKGYISMHGPEHHVLDGACILMAYYNASGTIDIDAALIKIRQEGLRMPGAMCGLWGVCGAVTSIGAALAIIDSTGPLSSDGTWGRHMEFTSAAVGRLGEVNGPRCCKRDAMLAFEQAVDFINNNYDVTLQKDAYACEYSSRNAQCIGDRCPYHRGTV